MSWVKKELYKEALARTTDEELAKRLRMSIEWCEQMSINSDLEGFSEEAAAKIEGMDIYYEKIGEKGTLHDAYIREFHYDRNKNTLTVAIDTWGVYDDSDYDTQVITIEFSDILNIETNIDPGNDYAWTSRCYLDGENITFELESAHLEIQCRKMRIVSVVNMNHDHAYQKGEFEV